MGHVIEKARQNEVAKRAHLTFFKHVVFENMETQPPTIIKTETYRIVGNNGRSLEQLIRRNGIPITTAPLSPGTFDFGEALATRYTFTLQGEEIINERAYFRIIFEPKEPRERLPTHTREDEGINRMTGVVLVDMEDFTVWKVEGRVDESFRKAGIFKLNHFELTFEQERKFDIMVPKTMIIVLNYSTLGFETHERRTYTYSDHADNRLH